MKKVTEDFEALRFNTAISALMTFVNEVFSTERPSRRVVETFVQLLHPLAPHLGEELWHRVHGSPSKPASVQRAPWPSFDPERCAESEVEIPVQVNGKVRGRVRVAAAATEDVVVAAALADDNVKKHVEGKEMVKRHYVAGRILTLVVK